MYVGKSTDPELSSNKSDQEADHPSDKMTYHTDGEQQRHHSNCLEGGGRASASARRLGTVVRMEDVQGNDYGEDQGDGNHEGGFGYSQKFFHISDGNLYSVFSPLQGRSYGVKPSFLRKHRCTVQETKGKKGGRRNARKGLKFHNFIPSESITSEREEGHQANLRKPGSKEKSQPTQGTSTDKGQSTSGEVWKVHAECRLREEHGTKQIMVSNWSLSSDSPALPSNSKSTSVQATFKTSNKDQETPMDVSLPPVVAKVEAITQQDKNFNSKSAISYQMRDDKQKPSVLQQYLEYGKMLPDSDSSMTFDEKVKQEQLEFGLEGDDNKKHRRKPTTTRRVVPYTKYLTMVDDGPLDLSCQKDKDSEEELFNSLNLQRTPFVMNLTSEVEYNINMGHHPDMYLNLSQCLSNKLPAPNTIQQQQTLSKSPTMGASFSDTSFDRVSNFNTTSSFIPQQQSQPNSQHLPQGYMSLQGSQHQINRVMQPNQEMGPRRKPSQRTIIRQKLEDTFKQNGFLVKTKQFSDGDATFCKFKQLRKYTRYYLKRWDEYLPDEVHKLWKGFLPPKTTLNNQPKLSNQEPEAITVQNKNGEFTSSNQEQVIC